MSSSITSVITAAEKALLSASGVVSATVGDILAAASDVQTIENTANSVLSAFVSAINDPIQTSFSQGQQYSGTFITAPTVQLTPLSLTTTALSTSTEALSQLSCAQIEALAARTGIDIISDTDLAEATAFLFNELSTIASLAFSIALDDSCICGCTAVTSTTTTTEDTTETTYTIPSITTTADQTTQTALASFISSTIGSFPNTPSFTAVATSVWVEGLSVSTDTSGSVISGVPQTLSNATYTDISTQTTALVPSSTPVTLIDYSTQQNLLNTTLALAIDNGLTETVTDLMGSSLVTPVSTQVIKNRLGSVAARGDTTMFNTLVNILGASNVANQQSLLSTLIGSLTPTDLTTDSNSTVFYAGGSVITTNTNQKTLAELIADVNTVLTTLDLTIEEVFSQNTCSSVFCSQSLLNIPLMLTANQTVLSSLFSSTTVQMANMFSNAA